MNRIVLAGRSPDALAQAGAALQAEGLPEAEIVLLDASETEDHEVLDVA